MMLRQSKQGREYTVPPAATCLDLQGKEGGKAQFIFESKTGR